LAQTSLPSEILRSWKCFLHVSKMPTLGKQHCYKEWFNFNLEHYTQYICKIQIHVQPLIDVQSSNPRPISTSQTSVPQIYVLFTNSQSVSNSQIYVLFQILKSGVQFSNLWPFLNFSNRRPMKSMTYALILTNKWAIDLKIRKGHRFKNTLKSDRDLR